MKKTTIPKKRPVRPARTPSPSPPPEPAPRQKRIYIVDDHPIFREGLAGVIRQQPDLMICGQADSAAKAFEEIPRVKPDLLLTDIGLPGKSGMELLKDIHAFQPDLPVLVLSMHDELLYAERVLRAGGRGYVMKQEGPDRIVQAVAKVLSGQIWVSEKMATSILNQMSSSDSKAKNSPIASLTDREFEVLRLIGEGKDGHDIARDLHLSLKTVNCHRASIRQKLGLKNSHAVGYFATRWLGDESQ